MSLPSLDEAIQSAITLGAKDPREVAEKLEHQYGTEWIAGELLALHEEIIMERARGAFGVARRSAEVALRPGNELAAGELKIAKAWIPGEGWKRAADLTAEDLDKRAAWYEQFAVASLRRAHWCREVAGMMRDQGAKTLGKLKAALPPLPEDEVLELPAVTV